MQREVVMKHKGAISQVYRKRDEIIVPQLFTKAKQLSSYPTTMERLFKIAAEIPVDQYYLSDDTAVLYIRNRIFRGINKIHNSPYKQRLFESLYQKVCDLRKNERYKSRGLDYVTMLALQCQAPCVGLSPAVMLQKYLQLKNKKRHAKV